MPDNGSFRSTGQVSLERCAGKRWPRRRGLIHQSCQTWAFNLSQHAKHRWGEARTFLASICDCLTCGSISGFRLRCIPRIRNWGPAIRVIQVWNAFVLFPQKRLRTTFTPNAATARTSVSQCRRAKKHGTNWRGSNPHVRPTTVNPLRRRWLQPRDKEISSSMALFLGLEVEV